MNINDLQRFVSKGQAAQKECDEIIAQHNHATELEAARVKVFALAKGAAEAVRHGGYVSEADAIDQAIADYDALAGRKP